MNCQNFLHDTSYDKTSLLSQNPISLTAAQHEQCTTVLPLDLKWCYRSGCSCIQSQFLVSCFVAIFFCAVILVICGVDIKGQAARLAAWLIVKCSQWNMKLSTLWASLRDVLKTSHCKSLLGAYYQLHIIINFVFTVCR